MLEENERDIIALWEKLAQENQNDMDIFGTSFMEMSLQNILSQALRKLCYHWYESGAPCTREGLYQHSMEV